MFPHVSVLKLQCSPCKTACCPLTSSVLIGMECFLQVLWNFILPRLVAQHTFWCIYVPVLLPFLSFCLHPLQLFSQLYKLFLQCYLVAVSGPSVSHFLRLLHAPDFINLTSFCGLLSKSSITSIFRIFVRQPQHDITSSYIVSPPSGAFGLHMCTFATGPLRSSIFQ